MGTTGFKDLKTECFSLKSLHKYKARPLLQRAECVFVGEEGEISPHRGAARRGHCGVGFPLPGRFLLPLAAALAAAASASASFSRWL